MREERLCYEKSGRQREEESGNTPFFKVRNAKNAIRRRLSDSPATELLVKKKPIFLIFFNIFLKLFLIIF